MARTNTNTGGTGEGGVVFGQPAQGFGEMQIQYVDVNGNQFGDDWATRNSETKATFLARFIDNDTGLPLSAYEANDNLSVIGNLFGATVKGQQFLYNDPNGYYGFTSLVQDPDPTHSLPILVQGIFDGNTGASALHIMHTEDGTTSHNIVADNGAGASAQIGLVPGDKAEIEYAPNATDKANFVGNATSANMKWQTNSVNYNFQLSNDGGDFIASGTSWMNLTPSLQRIGGDSTGSSILVGQGSSPAIALISYGTNGASARVDVDGNAGTVMLGDTTATQTTVTKVDTVNRQIQSRVINPGGSMRSVSTLDPNQIILETENLTGAFINFYTRVGTDGSSAYLSAFDNNTSNGVSASVKDRKFTVADMSSADVTFEADAAFDRITFGLNELVFNKTNTPSGTTGDQTIDTPTGSVNFGAGDTSLTVTSSLVTDNSIIICTVASNDAIMNTCKIEQTTGSFTIYPDNTPVGETRVNFIIFN